MEGNENLLLTFYTKLRFYINYHLNKNFQEKIVAKCLENRIAVYSPHTSFDSIRGGVNDWLASAFENGINLKYNIF